MGSPVLAGIPGIGPNPPLMSQNLAQNSIIHIDPNTGRDSETSTGSQTGPYRSITYALQRVQSVTVIQLNPGTYSQETGEVFPISLKDGVTLQGDEASNGQNTVIMGGGNFVSPTFARQNATIKTQGNSQIIGVTVTNPNTRGTGLWIESSSPVVSGCTFIESKRDGIFITSESNPKIQSNIFTQNAGNGISIARSGAGEIRNNVFQNTGFGISINDEASPTIMENKIIENRDGIVISHQAKPILRNNLIENNERDGVVAISQAQPDLGTTASPGQNIIRSNGRYDVYNATRGYTLTVVGNEIDQTRISGAVEF
jgi:parallel beta-helix repeat protein